MPKQYFSHLISNLKLVVVIYDCHGLNHIYTIYWFEGKDKIRFSIEGKREKEKGGKSEIKI